MKNILKYDRPDFDEKSPEDREIMRLFDSAFDRVYSDIYAMFDNEFRTQLNDEMSNPFDFSRIRIQGNSAAGYPYPPGTKKAE